MPSLKFSFIWSFIILIIGIYLLLVYLRTGNKGQKPRELKYPEIRKFYTHKRDNGLRLCYWLLFIGMVIYVSFLTVFCVIQLANLQQNLFEPNSSFIFYRNPFTLLSFLWLGFALAYISANRIKERLIDKYPRFGQYWKMKSIEYVRKFIRKYNYDPPLNTDYKLLFWLYLLLSPFIFLSFFNYAYASGQGIAINRFFSLQEKLYSWDQVESADIYIRRKLSAKDRRYFRVGYTVSFSDDTGFNLWPFEEDFHEVYLIDNILQTKKVNFQVKSIDKKTIAELKKRYAEEELYEIKSILKVFEF